MTAPTVDPELTALAERLAVDMVARLGYDPTDDENPVDWDSEAEDDMLDGVAHSLALAAGYDVDTLTALRDVFEQDTVASFVASIARIIAINTGESDEDRSAHLAQLVSQGIPVRARGFAPRHARMAAELVDDVDVKLWLLSDFAEHACALA